MALRYNFDRESYELLALKPLLLNDKELTAEHGFTVINALDKIYIPCNKCYIPHLFYFVMPVKEQPLISPVKEGG